MKSLKSILILITLATASVLPTKAGEYAIQAAFWNASSITNATGIATNLGVTAGSVGNFTQTREFTLQFVLGFTNACAGTYDVQWTCSGDGVTFVSGPAAPGASGWFSIPLTNSGAVVTWVTNITMGPCGYYKINYGTNQAGQSLTNAYVIGLMKPKQTNRDY